MIVDPRHRSTAAVGGQCRHHRCPHQRRHQHRLGGGGRDVGDPDLQGRELRRRPHIPIDHPVVEHRPGLEHHRHHRVVVRGGVEMWRRSRARPARPQHAAPAGVAGVGVAVDRRVGGQRQQQRQPRPQPVADGDRGFPVGYLDMYVASADALLVRDHSEPVGDPVVARGVGDRKVVRHRRWQADREQAGAGRLGGLGGETPQPGDLLTQSGAGVRLVGRGLHLTGRQLELEVDTAFGRVAGHLGITGNGFAGPGVDEEELLLHTDARGAHRQAPQLVSLAGTPGPRCRLGMPRSTVRQTPVAT